MTANHLQLEFGITKMQAHNDLKNFQQDYPGSLIVERRKHNRFNLYRFSPDWQE